MATNDKTGRPYAVLAELKPGDKIIADDGFPCIEKGRICDVREDEHGCLFVYCRSPDGHGPYAYPHYLEGQDDGDGAVVGFYPAP